MLRTHLPPTPSMSGEFTIQDKPLESEGPDFFVLPPAALTPTRVKSSDRESALYRQLSPTSPDLIAAEQSQGTTAAGKKHRLDDIDLPPPPTRTRRIIQMNPKTAASGSEQTKENASNNSKAGTNGPSKKKQKQPGPNSLGRKKARKTAHKVIERRRRSKMNEELGILKDMIPACRGQEMHKLAILQACIDYVNYLEKCVRQLKDPEKGPNGPISRPADGPLSPTSPDVLSGVPGPGERTYPVPTSRLPELLPGASRGNNALASLSSGAIILPSPILDPLLNKADDQQPLFHSWPAWLEPANHSPRMQSTDDHVGEASAALLMMNRDRRWTVESTTVRLSSDRYSTQETPRKTGLSVSDLLIS